MTEEILKATLNPVIHKYTLHQQQTACIYMQHKLSSANLPSKLLAWLANTFTYLTKVLCSIICDCDKIDSIHL